MVRRLLIASVVLAVFVPLVVYRPDATSEPAASPEDPAHEDLSRVEYPSLEKVAWEPRFIRPQDSIESLFGDDWPVVARFNRIDRIVPFAPLAEDHSPSTHWFSPVCNPNSLSVSFHPAIR